MFIFNRIGKALIKLIVIKAVYLLYNNYLIGRL